MAAKRFIDESSNNPDRPGPKRLRTRPSFAAVIGEVLMANSLQNFCTALEPLLRKVVNEEVERSLRRGASTNSRQTQLQVQAQEASTYQLSFAKRPSLPVFTGSKVEFEDSNELLVVLVDTRTDQITTLPYPVKVEIVVVDGDFPPGENEDWTSEQFNRKIVRERTGKRPLITGDVHVTVRDGCASIGELTFTDNSSWIRSRRFRIGAKVEQGSCKGVRIREAITEPFIVKDHRGELYKKHHPPALNDEVWRLEKIGKEGAFHRKLSDEGINTVQEFLKLWTVEPARLRSILGGGMSDKMFEFTIKHARTCILGNKHYMLRGPSYTIFLNPICQVVGFMLDGKTYPTRDLTAVQRVHIESLVRDAYGQQDSLEEVDRLLHENALLQLDEVTREYRDADASQSMRRTNQSCRLLRGGPAEVPYVPNVLQVEQAAWSQYSKYNRLQFDDGNMNYISDVSSDGDSTTSRIFFNGTL